MEYVRVWSFLCYLRGCGNSTFITHIRVQSYEFQCVRVRDFFYIRLLPKVDKYVGKWLFEVKLPFYSVCPWVGWLVGWSVGQSVGLWEVFYT